MGKIVTVSLADARRLAQNDGGITRHLADSEIDFSDIPPLTEAQLNQMKRRGRPPKPEIRKQTIAIRLRPELLRRLRVQAKRRNTPYQTYIHGILERAAARANRNDAR